MCEDRLGRLTTTDGGPKHPLRAVVLVVLVPQIPSSTARVRTRRSWRCMREVRCSSSTCRRQLTKPPALLYRCVSTLLMYETQASKHKSARTPRGQILGRVEHAQVLIGTLLPQHPISSFCFSGIAADEWQLAILDTFSLVLIVDSSAGHSRRYEAVHAACPPSGRLGYCYHFVVIAAYVGTSQCLNSLENSTAGSMAHHQM